MDIDLIFSTFLQYGVDYLLLGGMNFLLRHEPIATFDVDFWIEDQPANRARCEAALTQLAAEWGRTDDDWAPVAQKPAGWLAGQSVFCLISPAGSIDIFLRVKGLDGWGTARAAGVHGVTGGGVKYWGLSDEDMLRCQLALQPHERKMDRVRILEQAIARKNNHDA